MPTLLQKSNPKKTLIVLEKKDARLRQVSADGHLLLKQRHLSCTVFLLLRNPYLVLRPKMSGQ